MTTYSIYFQNNSGTTQTYGFFTSPPQVDSSVGNPKVYSNIWISKKIPGNGGNASVKTTNNYYAWCGTAPQNLAPGVVVSQGQGLLSTLGTNKSPGSTFTMFNDDGTPAFEDKETYTSSPGCYEIDTGTDFIKSQNFLIGLGAYDSAGRMVPTATFAAPQNATTNIAPVVKYFIAAYNAQQGTTIDWQSATKNAAVIDFSPTGEGSGYYNAVVTQDDHGKFSVKYTSQVAFANMVNSRAQASGQKRESTTSDEVRQLREQIQLIQQYFGIPNSPAFLNKFQGTLEWVGSPMPNDRNQISLAMQEELTHLKYAITNVQSNPSTLQITMTRQDTSLNTATEDWAGAYASLNSNLKGMCTNEGVRDLSQVAVKAQSTMVDKKQLALEYLAGQGIIPNGIQV